MAELVRETAGYSGADIEGLVREAALIALEENKMKPTDITKKHFTAAMQKVLPSLPEEVESSYAEFRKKLSRVHLSYVG